MFSPLHPVDAEVADALTQLSQGRRPRDIELQRVDFKEEPGRRDSAGNIQPGSSQSEEAANFLADELACMANTDGGGAVVLGVSDDGQAVGTQLDPQWLRHRIYELTDRRLTVDVQEHQWQGTRLLVLRAPEALEPIRYAGRVKWRVDDNCVEIDASTWAARHLSRGRRDWSAEPTSLEAAEALPGAFAVARRYLNESGEEAARDLAASPDRDLMTRLNVCTPDGYLTNAGALLFTASFGVGIDYIRRESPGADSQVRIRDGEQSVLEQLDRVVTAISASNRIVHIGNGIAVGQFRALPSRAVREAIVNGLTHRDWGVDTPTLVEHVGDSIVVTSPGGFVGGSIRPTSSRTHRLLGTAPLPRRWQDCASQSARESASTGCMSTCWPTACADQPSRKWPVRVYG